MRKKVTVDEFIQRAKIIHGDKYDYSKMNYINQSVKTNITCLMHGQFWQEPYSHLKGSGCPKCSNVAKGTNKDFIQRANETHFNRYNYSKVGYKNNCTKVEIICNKHGSFWQTPNMHIGRKTGCPKCKSSFGENLIRKYLIDKNIPFEEEKKFQDCIGENNNKLRFDFYLPEQNLCIEYDGAQHFEPHSFNSDKSDCTKLRNLELVQKRDFVKMEYCKTKNINLLRIPYWDLENITEILKKVL